MRIQTLAAIAVLAMIGCSQAPTAPTNGRMVVSASAESVAAGVPVTITATVRDEAGKPVEGISVRFTGSLGTFSPEDGFTAANGAVSSQFTATGSGFATITALSGNLRSDNSVVVRVGDVAVERLTLRAEPGGLPASGGVATIVASVLDSAGAGMPNVSVRFSADRGQLSHSTATTNGAGEARVSVTATSTARITANTANRMAELTLPVAQPPSVSVTCGAPGVGVAVVCAVSILASSDVRTVTVNWGDGSPEEVFAGFINRALSHTFWQPHYVTVTVRATDQAGLTGTGTASLTVVPTTTTGFALTTGSARGIIEELIAYVVTPPNRPAVPVANVTVDLGNGDVRNLGAITGQANLVTKYYSTGRYTATATMVDQAGQRVTSSQTIIICPQATPQCNP